MKKGPSLVSCIPFLIQGALAASPASLATPPEIWKDYNPDKGDFKQEIVKEETKDGCYPSGSHVGGF